MPRDPRFLLEDILEACSRILCYTEGLTFEDFQRDRKTLDAVLHNLVTIGEAVKKLPGAIRERYPDVEWNRIAGLRDVLVHEYFGVDEEIVWDIVQNKVPRLQGLVEGIIRTNWPE